MDKMFAGVRIGRKNIVMGAGLFILLGFGFGIPLTINFLGGSLLTQEQYQVWKVVHGYGVFLALINYFFGLSIDRLRLTDGQKELSSWAFLMAAVFGGIIRMLLVILSALSALGIYASLAETVFISLGTLVFLWGQSQNFKAGLAGKLAESSL
jgi:hypothetical protein